MKSILASLFTTTAATAAAAHPGHALPLDGHGHSEPLAAILALMATGIGLALWLRARRR